MRRHRVAVGGGHQIGEPEHAVAGVDVGALFQGAQVSLALRADEHYQLTKIWHRDLQAGG
jgi:hypothetical protein